MKKLLSIILAMVMLFSVSLALPVSADTTETVSKWDGTLPATATAFKVGDTSVAAGTVNNPYLIETAADLANLATYVNSGSGAATKGKYFKLCCDIDMDDKAWPGIGAMTAVGASADASKSFQGKFDGDGHVIYNLNLKSGMFAGVFTCVTTDQALICGLGIASGNITVSGVTYLGSLVGYLGNKAQIKNCFNSADLFATVTGTTRIGGIVGYVDQGAVGSAIYANIIDGCWNAGDINITNANSKHVKCGGIVGVKDAGGLWIKNCTNVGNIVCNGNSTQYSGFGSIIGEITGGLFVADNIQAGGSIKASWPSGVTYTKPIGSFIGYAVVNWTVTNTSYNVAAVVNGEQSNIGILGYNHNSTAATTGFTAVENIVVNDTTLLTNNFAQNGVGENAGNIRFVSELSISAGALAETGYVVEFGGVSGELSGKVVYTSLMVADETAESGYAEINPTGKYYIAYGLKDIPTTVSGTIKVTPYVVLLDGATVYGSAAEYTITAGALQENS